jgi:hypothetical protein
MRKRLVRALIATAVAIGAAVGIAGAAGAIAIGDKSPAAPSAPAVETNSRGIVWE